MAKALKIVGTVVAVVAFAASVVATAGASAFVAAGVSAATAATIVATAATIATIASIAAAGIAIASSFIKPPGYSQGGNPLDFVTNPQSPLPYGIGRTRMSGLKIHGDTTEGSNGKIQNDIIAFAVLLSAGGMIQGIDSFRADKAPITFDGSGAAIGTYAGFMSQKVSLGGSTALSLTLGTASMPGWTANHKLSGMAHALWMMQYDSKQNFFTAGVPEPEWVGRWVLAYDPRKDSTYPGGSGSHRPLQESTYEWTRNGALHALTWAMGRVQNGKRTLGIGAPLANIRVADFVAAANLADTNNWNAGGFSWSTDSKWGVLKQFLQSCGAVPTMTGAMIGCMVNAPRVSITTISSQHLLNGMTIAVTKSRRDRYNTIVPRFRSEAHEWEIITGSPIKNATYIAEDGAVRSKEVDFPFVQHELVDSVDGHAQVGELAAYMIVNSREAGPISFTTGPQFIGIKSGDCVTLDVPEEGIVAQPVIIQSVTIDPANATVAFTAETETVGKHAFALAQTTTPPPAYVLTPKSQIPDTPSSSVWSLAATNSFDGLPSITITGANEYSTGTDVIIQHRVVGAAAWQAPAVFSDPRGTVKHEIVPLEGNTAYEVQIAYRNTTGQGPWRALGPVTTPLASVRNPALMTIAEKLVVIPQEAERTDRYTKLRARMVALSLSVIGLDLANTNWLTYRNGLSPAWNATTADSPLVRATWDTLSTAYDVQLNAADKAISEEDAKRALWDGVTGTGKDELIAQAASADSNATSALNQISNIVADGILDKSEKPDVVLRYNALIAEQSGIDTQAGAFGVTTERTAYNSAITALTNYLVALSPAYNSYTTDTSVVRATFNTNFTNAYTARQTLLNKLAEIAKARGDLGVSNAATAQAAANTAQTAANTAQTDANTANTTLANIASDNILTAGEKPEVMLNYDVIIAERAGILARADAYGITTDRTNYNNAVSDLTTYLNTLGTPVNWNILIGDTTIVGTTFRNYFKNAYDYRQILLNKIAEIAGQRANWDQTSGRPALITGEGVTVDEFLLDPSVWSYDSTGVFSNAAAGDGWFSNIGTSAASLSTKFANATPIDPTASYEVSIDLIEDGSGAGTATSYLGVALFDANGTVIGVDGTWWHYFKAAEAVYARGAWETYSVRVGKGTAKPFPANAAKMGLVAYVNYNNQPSVTCRVRRMKSRRVTDQSWTSSIPNRWTLANGRIVRHVGAYSWGNVAYGRAGIKGPQRFAWRWSGQGDAYATMCGLSETATPVNFTDGVFTAQANDVAGAIHIYQGGTLSASYTGQSDRNTAEFAIEYDGLRLKLFKNGVAYGHSRFVGPDKTFYPFIDTYYPTSSGIIDVKHASTASAAVVGGNTFTDTGTLLGGPDLLNTEQLWSDVDGVGRPEDYATSSENLIVNGIMANSAQYWQLSAGVTVATHGVGNPAPFSLRLPQNADSYSYPNNGSLSDTNGATKYFVSGWAYKATAGNGGYIGLQWFYANGTQTGSTAWQEIPATGAWGSFKLEFNPPTSAARARMLVHSNSGTGDAYVGNVRFSRVESGATVGAIVGVNTKDIYDNILVDGDLRNNQIRVENGQFLNPVGLGSGTEVSNARLRVAVDTGGTSGRARARLFRDEGVTFINEVELPAVVQNVDQQWSDVSGAAKPADYATRNEEGANLIANAATLQGLAHFGTVLESNTPLVGQQIYDYLRVRKDANGSDANTYFTPSAVIPVNPGERLYTSYHVFCASALGGVAAFGLSFVDATNAIISTSFLSNVSPTAAGWVQYQDSAIVPAGAAKVAPFFHFQNNTSGSWYAARPYLGRAQLGATVGAAWGTNVTDRPTELTDGRVATALDTNGYNQVGIKNPSLPVVANTDLMAGLSGTQIAKNPEFAGGSLDSYTIYNNAGGTKTTFLGGAPYVDLNAPNGSGYVIGVNYDGTGTEAVNPTPGFGGITISLLNDGGNRRPGYYSKRTFIIYKIWAAIPVGRTINWASNPTGAESTFEWLTSTAGTGGWQLYIARQYIGTSGTFSSTGFLFVAGGANVAFTWYLAKYEAIDITSPARQFLGRGGLIDESGNALFNGNVRNEDLRIVDDAGGTGGRGRLTLRRNAGGVDIETIQLGAPFQNKDQQWPDVTGTGRPEDNATVGARANVNLRKEDNTVIVDPDFLNNRLEGNVLRVATPVGGAIATSGTQTGALKIQLPASTGSTMMRVFVDVYEYNSEASQTYEVGGYTYNGVNWINCFCNAIGRSPNVRPVRFGIEGGYFCIFIGELAGTWSYPSVRLRDLQASYSAFTEAAWKEGWALSWKTSAFAAIDATITKPVAGDAIAGLNTRRESGTVVGDALLMNDNQRFDQVVSGYGRPSDNATADIKLVGTGAGIVITGNRVTRPTGGGDWTAQAYTPDGYVGGAYCSFSFEFNAYVMAGLNTDPTTDASYGSLDFSFYCPADSNILQIRENGNDMGSHGGTTASTILSIVYDNEYVRYLKDGAELRAVYVGAGKKYHFDSSIVQSPGLTNIRFGPYAAANAPLSFINTTGHTSDGNTVFKRANATNDWDGKSISREISQGTAFVTGKLDTVDTFIGLHEVGNSNATFPAFAYSIHRSSNGTWAVYEDGGSPLNLGSGYDNNTQWSIRYDGVNVRYYAGTTLLRTVASPASRSFQAGAAIYSQNSRVSAIQFGPYTDRSWSNIAGTGRPEDNATVGAVAGTNLVDVNGNAITHDSVRNNLALIDWWKEGASIPWSLNSGGNGIFTYNRAGYSASVTGPQGFDDDCWYCYDDDGDPGGGWNGAPHVPLNQDKTYRFVVPVMRLSGGDAGVALWGPNDCCSLNTTTPDPNPYFAGFGRVSMVGYRWYLMIGYLYPRNSTNKSSASAGIWDTVTGSKVGPGTNFCFRSGQSVPMTRAYQYYVSGASEMLFGKPLIECYDGTQSSLREYFRDTALLNNQQRFDEIVAGNGKPEANADVTLTAQLATEAPADVNINADYLGAIISGQFNKILTPVVLRGGVSVRTDNRATYSVTNVTGGVSGYVSVNNTTGSGDKGRVTVTNCTSSGTFTLNIFWDSVLIAAYLIKFTVVPAGAPIGGGGAGGTKSGSFSAAGVRCTSTSFIVVGQINNLTKASGETIRGTFTGDYYAAATVSATRSAVMKWQYSPTGANSWTDFAAQVTGSGSFWNQGDFAADPGSITVNQNAAPADAAYDVRLLAAMNTTGSSSSIEFDPATASVIIGV